MEISESAIKEAKSAISKIPFESADQYLRDRYNVIQKVADANKLRSDDLMLAWRNSLEGIPPMTSGDLALEKATIKSNLAKAAPMETPYGKSFLSYTPEGKVAGMAGKVLRGAAKVAGPVGAAMTAGELGGALVELRKLGAEKIAAENEAKQAGYTPEERLKLKDMIKKLRAEAKLR